MTVPPPVEDEASEVANEIEAALENPQCRFCDYVAEGETIGAILEDLADHGEEAHDWDDGEGWRP